MRSCVEIPGHVLGGGPHIMGVVNVTPDSFADGGKYIKPDKAIEHGLALVQQGAAILDIGGESTRPGAQPVDVEEEMRRVVPVIEGLRGKARFISIDTRNAQTMEAALNAGANAINDISSLSHDPASIAVAAAAKVPVFLMHMQGAPETMQKKPIYNNVVEEVFQYLQERMDICETHRIDASLLVGDPGIGFGKSVEDNVALLRNIKRFHSLGAPVAVGVSRKSFIAKLSAGEPPDDRIPGSLSAALWGLSQGVQIFRVHDVQATAQAFKIYSSISGINSQAISESGA